MAIAMGFLIKSVIMYKDISMKKITILLLITVFTSVVIAEVAKKKSSVDILIEKTMETYEKSVKDADETYKKYMAPKKRLLSERRDKEIIRVGDVAIKKLESTIKRTNATDEGIKLKQQLEQQIEKVRQSISDKVGSVAEIKNESKLSVLVACGKKYKGHTYLAISSNGIQHGWKTAKDICEKMGGHLAYIETADELAFLNKSYGAMPLWIGGTDEHKRGDWRWLNGEPMDKFLLGKINVTKNNLNYMFYANHKVGNSPEKNRGINGFICEWDD